MLVAAAALSVPGFCLASANAGDKKPDLRALARVNDETVTVQDLLDQFNSRHSGHSKFLGGDAEARKFLKVVIDDRLLVQEAWAVGIGEEPEAQKYIRAYEDAKAAEYYVTKEITEKALAPPAEVRAIWETSLGTVTHARHIVTATAPEAEQIRAAVMVGADFETLARECSLAPSSRRGADPEAVRP